MQPRAITAERAPAREAGTARLVSLDLFRGATMAAMILVNNPGSSAIYAPLEHAEWHGWTFTDLIFPFFLWIVGVAMTLSFARRVERGESRRGLFLHVLRRSALIFAVGLALNGFPYYRLATLRIPGVLQRIAVCYLIAGSIFLFTKLRGQIVWTASLLAVYWALMMLVPVPGYGPGVLAKEGNLAGYVDGLVLSGHMWSHTRTWDPEGLLSTLPAIATTLFGIGCGHILRARLTAPEKTAWMFVAGNALLCAGAIMNWWLPINKNLWTSSFSVWMAGMAFVGFALCYWFADVLGRRRWTRPFVIFGMNALAVYVFSGVVARLLGLITVGGKSLHAIVFDSVFAPLASPRNASLLYALANVGLLWLVAWIMYRRRWFVRL